MDDMVVDDLGMQGARLSTAMEGEDVLMLHSG